MCLGIPGKVVETYREHDVLMGKVDFGMLAYLEAPLKRLSFRVESGSPNKHTVSFQAKVVFTMDKCNHCMIT